MKSAFLVALLLLTRLAYGQSVKTVSIPTFKNLRSDADTSLYFKWDRAISKKTYLPDLQKSADAFHFRLWTGRQVLDIWTLDKNRYFGAVTSYAQHYDAKLFQKGIRQVDTVLFKRVSLSDAKAKQIFQLIDSLAIPSIPSDNQIAGWQDGFDGTEYRIETVSPNFYAYKTYWTPRIFADTLWEARQIQTFVDKLYDNFKLADYARQLRLLPGHYQHEGIEGIQISTWIPSDMHEHKLSIFDWF